MAEPIGPLVDAIGVTAPRLEAGDLVSTAIVLTKIVEADGTVGLRVCRSDGISYIETIGMLQSALHAELSGINSNDDDPD